MNLLSELITLIEANQSLIAKVEKLSVAQVIELAEYSAKGDDVTPLVNAKTKSIEEVTTTDQDDVVVNIEFFYRTSRFIASVYIEEKDGKLEATNVDIEKDVHWGHR